MKRLVPRRSVAVACTSLALALAGCGGGAAEGGGASDASKSGGKAEGTPAPAFTAEPVTGDGPKSLADAKGKVVILDFWGTFCKPCKQSFPKYQEIVDQMGGQVVVLAVSVDEPENVKKDDLVAFAKDTNVKFSIVWDKDHSAADKYKPLGAGETMPTSFIIDKEGVIRHVHSGFHDGDEAKVAEEVKQLSSK